MALKLITPASVAAVSLAEAKAHLNVTHSADDAQINAMVAAATELAEQKTGRALMAQTWEVSLDAFPDAIELTRVPVQSITSVIYRDPAGAAQTLAASEYALDSGDGFGSAWIVPAYGTDWPAMRDEVNAVKARFVAGYASAAEVPESIKAFIKIIVSTMYEHREEVVTGTIVAALTYVESLLDRYKVY